MWIFNEHGFFSIVLAHAQDKGKRVAKRDPNKVMIRARCRAHLESLMGWAFDDGVDHAEIIETANRDYMFRIVIPKTELADLMLKTANELSTANFKNSVAAKWGHSDPYTDLCHNVWGEHYAMQKKVHGAALYG